MRKQLILLAAGSLAAGTFGFLGSTTLRADQPYGGASDSPSVGTSGARAAGNITLPQGINLASHITEFDNMKGQWPADANEAYRLASHHIFMALYDTGGAGGM